MIATRNRSNELRRTLAKIAQLTPRADEVFICADGCTDATVEMVRSEFPFCVLVENPASRGSVYSRARLLQLATADIVVSLDDDSYPMDADFLRKLADVFSAHPEAAVVTFLELRGEPAVAAGAAADIGAGSYVAAYPNCAAAMRRDVYFATGGFPSFFVHMYEEPDFALQVYARGYAVWFEPSVSVRHHMSEQQRSVIGRHHLNARNEFWAVLLRCPMPWCPLVALYRLFRQMAFAIRQGIGWALREPRWWYLAARQLGCVLRSRQPVPWRVYRGWLLLSRRPVSTREQLRVLGIPATSS